MGTWAHYDDLGWYTVLHHVSDDAQVHHEASTDQRYM